MQDKLSMDVRPFFFNTLLWAFGVTLLLMSKGVIERTTEPGDDSSLDLALVLIAYLLFFLLNPIQAWINRRLRKRARRLNARNRP